ncbi:MAG: ComEC/Rec2 family competence protein [Cyclobacteriaceae bacterium]|nr:ComEC/Rec2 family competence protein [Cyclobacteriaceae bacterium]
MILFTSHVIMVWKWKKRQFLNTNVFSATIVFSAFISAGYLSAWLHDDLNRSAHFSKIEKEDHTLFLAEIIRVQSTGEKVHRYLAKMQYVKNGYSSFQKVNGRIWLSLHTIDRPVPAPGDLVVVTGWPESIPDKEAHDDFNYKGYSRNQNVYFQCHAWKDQWQLMDRNNAGNFLHVSRTYLHSQLNTFLKNKDAIHISTALLLGDKSSMDKSLRLAYSEAGAMHILAVSGLHVGILYLIIAFLCRPIPENRSGRWIKTIICIAAIWAYAFITGLSPSVIRAAIMFSFVALGSAANRKGNIYNTLAAAAFFTLLYDPFMLFAPGFQLSYTAVLGIVSFFNPIYHLLYLRWTIPDYFWKITCVTIGAQLGTLPVSVYYFNQIPVYSVITNLLAIPGAAVILSLSLLLVITGPIPALANFIGKLLDLVIQQLNLFVQFIQQQPGAVIAGLQPDIWMTFLIYGIISCWAVFIYQPKIKWIALCLVLSIAFSGMRIYKIYQQHIKAITIRNK